MDLPTDHIPDEPINFIYIQSFFKKNTITHEGYSGKPDGSFNLPHLLFRMKTLR